MNNELPKLNRASWIRNFGRSVKYAVVESFNEHFPMAEAYKNQSPNDDLNFARKELRTRRKFFSFVSKNTGLDTFFNDVDLAYKNMKTSMKSGNFYNSRRARKAEGSIFESMGIDNSEIENLEKYLNSDFNDDSEESLDKEGHSGDLSSLEKDLEQGFSDNSQIISEAVTGSADYIAGSIKGAANIAYSTSLQTIRELKFGFSNLNSGIAAINQFNKDQMTAHIANTTKYFDTTTNLLQQQNMMIKGLLEIQTNLYEAARKQGYRQNYDPLGSIIDPFSGAIDFKAYKEQVKANFNQSSSFGPILNLLIKEKDKIVANPMHFLLKQSLSILGGDRVEKALDDMQKNIVNSLYTLNAKITKGDGLLGGILSMFGIKAPSTKYANTQFEKGPMQFNGAANKSIVEVIPTYLARIEAALTGGPAKFYDMERGTWITSKEIRERWDKYSTGNATSRFIKTNIEKIVNNKDIGEFTQEQKRDLRKMLSEDVIPALRQGNGVIRKNKIFNKDRTLNSEFLKIVGLSGKNYDKDMIELIGHMFEQMSDSELRSLVPAVRSDNFAKSQSISNIGSTPYDINNIIVNGALSGTNDSKYHLNKNSIISANRSTGDLAIQGSLLTSNANTIEILKGIYNEVFDIHSLMESVDYTNYKGKRKNKRQSKDNNRQKIDFDQMLRDEYEYREYITDIDEEESNGINDLFGGQVEIDFSNANNIIKNFVNFVRNDLLSYSSFSLVNPAHRSKLIDFCNVIYKSPIETTGNIYFDDFVKHVKLSYIDTEEDFFNWIDDSNNKSIIYNLIYAIKYRADSKLKYSNNTNKSSSVKNALKEVFNNSPTEKYNSYEGVDFLDKLSRAKGFDKLGVISSKLKSITESPVNMMVKGVNTTSSFLGNLISGEFSSALNDITSLFGGGRAYGGTITGTGPRLYALSPGEKVIPAYLNPDNPNRRKANPFLDAIRENALLATAQQSGIRTSGGLAFGAENIFEEARKKFDDFKNLGEEKFDKLLENYIKQYIPDEELMAPIKEAIKEKNTDKLKLAIASAYIKDAANDIKNSASTLWGNITDKAKGIDPFSYIPDSVRENVKEIGKYTVSGSALGLASGLLGGPFGIIGGTLLGAAVGAVKKSDEAQNMLFGPGLGRSLKAFFGSNKKGTNMAAVGATVGGLVGGPFGAVGGLILGTGINFVKSSEKFDELMFGEKGIVTKLDNFFGETFTKTRKDIGQYIKEAITEPIDRAIIPVGTALQIGFKKSFDLLEKGLKNFIQPKIFGLTKYFTGNKPKNKYVTGAIGGAAGGALVGGPMGAVIGGVVGSIAHGTGFDKQFVKIGKLPGKMLNSFTDKLASWEIKSGQGFNWSAKERLDKMKDIYGENSSAYRKYKNSTQGKLDIKLSESNREDLIDVEMLIDIANGKDPKYKQALKETLIGIENALVTAGVDTKIINDITKKISKEKNVTATDLYNEIIGRQPDLPIQGQKELTKSNGDFVNGVNRYTNLLKFIDKYENNNNAKEEARNALKKQWGIDDSNMNNAIKNIRAEKDRKPLEKKNTLTYKAVDAIAEYGNIISNNLSSGFNKVSNYLSSFSYIFTHPNEEVKLAEDGSIVSTKTKSADNTIITTNYTPNGGRVVRTEKLNDNGKVLWATEEFYNKDGQKVDPNMADDKRDKESVQEKKEKDEAKALAEKSAESQERQAEATETLVNQNKGLLGFFKNMGKSSNGIMKGLKDVFSFITSPIRSLFGAFDSFMDSIPIIGDAWNYGKMKLRTGAKALGAKAMGYLNKKFFDPAKTKGSSWINRQRRNLGKITNSEKYIGAWSALDWMGSDNTGRGSFARRMDAWGRLYGLKYGDPSKVANILNDKYLSAAAKLESGTLGKKLGNLYLSGADKLSNMGKFGKSISDKMLNDKYLSKLDNLINKINTKSGNLANRMMTDVNIDRAGKWASKLAKPGSKIMTYGGKAASKIVKFTGKWGGKFLGAALDVIDSMAIYNSMKEAEQSVEIPDENPEAALPIMAKILAGISASIPLIGEAIKRGPVDGIGDLIGAIGGKAGTIGKLAKGKGTRLLAAGKGLLKGKGLKGAAVGAIALGAGYLGVKTGLITQDTAVSSAETAANVSRVSSFFSAAYKSICKVASKFLSPEKAKLLSGLGGKILKTITNPAVFGKIGSKMLKRIAGVIAGPAGWAVLGVFAAKAFYDGFSGANNIWKPKQGEEMTITKKAICGLAYAIADFCCLDLVMPIEQIVGMIKSVLGFTNEELETGGSFASSIFDGNIPTLINVKDWMKKLDNSIFDINLTQKWNENIWQPLKDFGTTLWNKITEKFNQTIKSITDFAENIADWWKNFSIKDAITGALTKGKEYLLSLFNFNVGEKSKKLIEEDSNSLEVHQLDEDDEAAVAKARASIPSSIFDDIFGTKSAKANRSSGRKHIGSLTARDMSGDYKSKWNIPGSGDGGFFKLFRWGKGDGGNGDDLPVQIWRYLESKNIGSSAIAGIMGNIQAESGFMPNRVQGAGVQTAPEITVDGQTGYGLCQWTYPTRQQALKDFAASRNKSSSDLETQLDFMLQEINQRDSGLLGRMAKMDPYDAAIHFHDEYEGSADDASMKARRGDYAKEIFQNQGRGIKTPGAYAASGGSSTSGGGGGSMSNSSGGGIFSEIGKLFENSALGKLGKELFGDAGFFTSGLFGGGSSSSNGGKYGGGAGSSRSTPRGKGKPNDRGILTEEPEEGQYWVRQTGGVTLKGCHVQALEVLDCLGKFFYEHTGHKLVVTAGTNGKHAEGTYSHASGWKLDVNDWYGPENLQGGWITEGASFTSTFKKFGHDNGLGMADEGDHIDIQFADGYDWQDGQYYGGWDAVHGKKANTSMSVADFLTTSLNGAITGKYGESRDNGNHGGIDIGANLGIPIKSPIDGEVTKIAYEPGGYGNYLQIRDSKGKYHLFAHLDKTPKLELGNKIKAGQEIAEVGSSGLSSGPHLHYQIDPESNKEGLKKGPHIDPNSYELDPKVRSFIEEQNSVADFRKMDEQMSKDKGDGGFLDPLKDAIVANKAENYNDKLDILINILGSILEVIKFAAGNMNTNSNPTTNEGSGSISAAIPALAGATMPKMNTTTPGKSIQSIVANMLKIAMDNA